MKRILIVCCMLAATATYSTAQQAAPGRDLVAAVSKSDFSQKVKELDKQISKGKTEEANNTFTDINKMANAELSVTRTKMRAAQNEADKKKYGEITMNQRMVFAQALKMKQEDMAGNQKQIIAKLKEFAGTID